MFYQFVALYRRKKKTVSQDKPLSRRMADIFSTRRVTTKKDRDVVYESAKVEIIDSPTTNDDDQQGKPPPAFTEKFVLAQQIRAVLGTAIQEADDQLEQLY